MQSVSPNPGSSLISIYSAGAIQNFCVNFVAVIFLSSPNIAENVVVKSSLALALDHLVCNNFTVMVKYSAVILKIYYMLNGLDLPSLTTSLPGRSACQDPGILV